MASSAELNHIYYVLQNYILEDKLWEDKLSAERTYEAVKTEVRSINSVYKVL